MYTISWTYVGFTAAVERTYINVKSQMPEALNLLRAFSSESWGADRCTLMRLYRSIIRPKLDYGALVYCSASDNLLKSLDVIPNEAIRISTGAFKSTPITSLNMLTNEPYGQTEDRIIISYYFKMKCFLLNPAYECVLNDTLHRQLAVGGTVASAFIVRVGEEIRRFNLPTQPVLPFKTTQTPWGLGLPMMDYDLTSIDKRNTPCSIVTVCTRNLYL